MSAKYTSSQSQLHLSDSLKSTKNVLTLSCGKKKSSELNLATGKPPDCSMQEKLPVVTVRPLAHDMAKRAAVDSCNQQSHVFDPFHNSSEFPHHAALSVLYTTTTVKSVSLETIVAFNVSEMVSTVVCEVKGVQNRKSSCISPSYLTKSKFDNLATFVNLLIWRAMCCAATHLQPYHQYGTLLCYPTKKSSQAV